MSEEKKVFEVLDEVKSLGEIITRCIEKGEMENKLVANWTFNILQMVGKMGKLVEELEESLDLLEEELEKKNFNKTKNKIFLKLLLKNIILCNVNYQNHM